ncbi:MAG TPA: fructosamine kinase family protein [Roseiflexaceae bacterium]|nr:fructosamine kinase family protein [Roseiflexaceae bacterium]
MSDVEAIAAEALRQAGDTTPLAEWQPVSGGMISQTARIRSRRGEYLLKWGGRGLPGFFAAEARGLELLAAAQAVRVPQVLAFEDFDRAKNQGPRTERHDHDSDSQFSVLGADGFILLEWLEPPPRADRSAAFEQLGRALAALHRASAPQHGLDHDNYLGIVPQQNGWQENWALFFRDRRLRPQGELAQRNGHMRGERAHHFKRLLGNVESLLADHTPLASLLHGDLWSGNVLVGPGGAPALVDPAVSYSDREAELGYTALFGGFPEQFYRAYEETWPLPDGWRERRELYNLYHLVNHLNHFGESYGGAVDATLRRLVGR